MDSSHVQRSSLAVTLVIAMTSLFGIGEASASTIEKWLIMPGPVVQAHVRFENECELCHDPLSNRPQFELCVDCHTEVGKDLSDYKGYHGKLLETERIECASCHAEHEGRDLEIVILDEATFDHDLTDFALLGGHQSVPCGDCHEPERPHRDAPTVCFDCHKQDDPHERSLGDGCDNCHTVNDWLDVTFDHDQSDFPLTGGHKSVACGACHTSTDFADAGTECIDCHLEDDVHKGRNGTDCTGCHNTNSWTQLTFSHLAVSGFALDGGHGGLECMDCHQAKDYLDLEQSTCHSCHVSDDVHEGRNGTDCASCHVVDNWGRTSFDHSRSTDFPLPAGHSNLECTACHTGSLHDELPRDCGGCHIDDDPHNGQLGSSCEGCHVADSWTAKLWFDHDLTSFPLLGAHAELSCEKCHATAAFHDAGESCISCHQDDDPHEGGLGTQCDACHNPSTWQAWVFDHSMTGFELTGAHEPLACNDCHRDTGNDSASISGGCISCHRRDDPHAGRFGDSCENCHSTSNFTRIEGM